MFKIKVEAQKHLKKQVLAAKSTYQMIEYRKYQSSD